MRCLNCDIKIEKPKRKFCSHSCGTKYWNKTHKEKCDESYNNFIENNPNHFKGTYSYEKYIKWRKENPKKWKEIQGRKHQKEMKDKVKHSARRFGYKQREEECEKCGSKEKLEFHHTNYKTKEGKTLCIKCHNNIIKKGGKKHNGKSKNT